MLNSESENEVLKWIYTPGLLLVLTIFLLLPVFQVISIFKIFNSGKITHNKICHFSPFLSI